jgi:hypothetical protein
METRKRFLNILIVLCTMAFVTPHADAKYINNPNKKLTNTIIKPAYTVATAKTEAFKNVKAYLPLLAYKSELSDKYYSVNMNYMKKGINRSGDESRILFPFYVCDTLISYGVRYADKQDHVYYYNSQGKLLRIEIDNNNPEKYPKKIITYNNKGKLHTVVLYVSETEQYNFDGMGNLVVHWIGQRGFNKYGKPIKIKRSI